MTAKEMQQSLFPHKTDKPMKRRIGRWKLHRAAKPHICIGCDKTISKGSYYYGLQRRSQLFQNEFYRRTGVGLLTIQLQLETGPVWFVDAITWRVCSEGCLRQMRPEVVLKRMRRIEKEAVDKRLPFFIRRLQWLRLLPKEGISLIDKSLRGGGH